jgi:mannosyl-oligosaccharide alpha-1,2-mannosidase
LFFSGNSKNWNWAAGGCSILSELGTMHLEFQYLSQLTGKDIYVQKVKILFFIYAEENPFFSGRKNP